MYRIEIKRIDKNVPFKGRSYEKITDEMETENAKYGYVYFDNTKDVKTEVYKQVVDDLDLIAVITAVNKENK